MKRCRTSLLMREMEIKPILRYYFTPIRMPIIKKMDKAGVGKNVEKLELPYAAGGNIKQQPLWKTVWQCVKKLNIASLCDPTICHLGIYLKTGKHVPTKTGVQMFTAALLIKSQGVKSNAQQLKKKETKCGTSIQWAVTQTKKGIKSQTLLQPVKP